MTESSRTSHEPRPLIVALGGQVLGLHPETGARLWHNQLQGSGHSWVAIAVSDECVLASASAARIFCLDRQTGATRWTQPTSGLGRATILLDEGQIYVAKSGQIDCFQCTDGTRVWTSDQRKLGKASCALGLSGNVEQADGKA